MIPDDAAKGVRVRFMGGEIGLLGELGRSLKGKTGTIVYGVSEDIFCYPDNPERPAADEAGVVGVSGAGGLMTRKVLAAG